MVTVLLTLHTLIVLALIGVVLLQRSEGGALGMGGGGGGGGGMMTSRGAANALTRLTTVLAGCFFATSIVLALVAGRDAADEQLFDALAEDGAPTESAPAPAAPSTGDLLGAIGSQTDTADADTSPAPSLQSDVLDALADDATETPAEDASDAEEAGESEDEGDEPPRR